MNSDGQIVQYSVFKAHKNIIAFTSTKQTLDIADVRYSNHAKNKAKLARVLGINTDQLIFPEQTHSNCVREIDDIPVSALKETDALISNSVGICICVQTADCVPLVLFDPLQKVVAAVHAGWRGTVGNIVGNTVRKMIENYDCLAENMLVAIGPSISPEVYEVGNEVVDAAKNTIPNVESTLHKNALGNYHFNLWEANRQLLMASGLNPENIEVLGECSFQNSGKYYSARRHGIDTGRLVSGIMLV